MEKEYEKEIREMTRIQAVIGVIEEMVEKEVCKEIRVGNYKKVEELVDRLYEHTWMYPHLVRDENRRPVPSSVVITSLFFREGKIEEGEKILKESGRGPEYVYQAFKKAYNLILNDLGDMNIEEIIGDEEKLIAVDRLVELERRYPDLTERYMGELRERRARIPEGQSFGKILWGLVQTYKHLYDLSEK